MKVRALIAFSPDGTHRYRRGDVFEMSDASARFLIRTRKVERVDEPEKKKTYSRRDMRAQD